MMNTAKTMKIGSSLLLVLLCALPMVAHAQEAPAQPVKIILDSDMGGDTDDGGAAAMLHALQDFGECEVIANIFCTSTGAEYNEYGAGYWDAINHYYGRGDIPIGANKVELENREGGSKAIYGFRDVESIAKNTALYGHKIVSSKECPSAIEVYRRALAEAEDGSVTILTIGEVNVIPRLLDSPSDTVSELTGYELVRRKVSRIVSMGPPYNWGIARLHDPLPEGGWGQQMLEKLPPNIPVYASPGGGQVRSGMSLYKTPVDNPVRENYRICNRGTIDSETNHHSMDACAAYFAVRGAQPGLQKVTAYGSWVPGEGFNCYNVWDSNIDNLMHFKIDVVSNADLGNVIDELMGKLPAVRETPTPEGMLGLEDGPDTRSRGRSIDAIRDDTFEQRAQNIIDASANTNINWGSFQSVKFSALKASALFAKGRDTDAFSILNNIYKGMAIKNFEDPEMPLWSLMDTYYRWKDKFSQRDTDALKAFINADIIDGDRSAGTPNHYWMMAAGLLLANQHWGEGEMRYTYDRPGGVEGWIKNKLTEIVHYGYDEYNSETYMVLNAGPILTVADFAEDPEIKKMARMTLDWMLINAASSHLDGHYAAATKRTYARLQRNNNALSPSYLYFGGPRNTGQHQVPFALSSYRAPGVAFQIANDRAEPFHLQFAHYTSYAQPNLSSKLNSWITPEYAVYSQYEVNNDLGPRDHMSFELDRWGVKWTDANSGRYSHFAVQHPHPKSGGDHMGGTVHEQMLHDKNTVISAYSIPKNRPAEFSEQYWRPYISGQMANTELAKIDEMNNGRLFLYFKEVMIGMAFLPRKAVVLNRATEYYHFKIDVTDDYLAMGLLVETADPDDYPGSTNSQKLSAFRDACTKAFDKAVYTSPGGKPVIEYVNLGGVRMKLAWAERKTLPLRQINGVDVPNLDKRDEGWLINSPWVKQKIGHDHLYISHGGDRRIYDFGAWSIDSTSNNGKPTALPPKKQ